VRILEISIVAVLVAHLVFLLSPGREDYLWLAYLPYLCMAIIAFHLLFEGYRWQMLPIYLVAFAGVLQSVIPQWMENVQAQYVTELIGLCCVGGGVVLCTVFPVFQLPPPTGPNSVGTNIRYVVDKGRSDPLTPNGARELMIQVWYPAAGTFAGKVAAYQEKTTTTAWNARFSLVNTHSTVDAPLADSVGHYPVLLYAPSWDGMRTENTHLAEQLASHGYIVVGIDHPYSSSVTTFPDGRIIKSRLVEEGVYSTEAAFSGFLKTIETEIRTRADDVRSVLNFLEDLNTADPLGLFENRLDMHSIGIFGFSLGGGVAAQACWLDRRFKACLNMDGVMADESLDQGAIAPLFIMSQNDPLPPDSVGDVGQSKRREMAMDWEQFVQMRRLYATFGGYWLTLKRAKHFNFSDYAFSSPVRFVGRSGTIDPKRAARAIGESAFAFFELYLRGNGGPLLKLAPYDLADARFEKSTAASASKH
jgi:predicted dienelactone hydrolase